MSGLTYYVMDLVEGNECALFNRPTFESAVTSLLAEADRRPEADLSVWRSDGQMLVPSVEEAHRLMNPDTELDDEERYGEREPRIDPQTGFED